MNGFTAADMSTAAANGHAEGYQAGYADAVKAVEAGKDAAAPVDLPTPRSREKFIKAIEGMSVSVDVDRLFDTDGRRLFGTVTTVQHDDGDKHGLTLLVQDAQPNWEESTPAAPGIDLRNALLQLREDALHMKDPGDTVNAYDRVLRLIDASPKGGSDALQWAVSRWNAEVCNRPLVNVHRRSLDDAWRQVIRHLGGDDVTLCGPRHDDLLATMQATSAEVGA